MTKQRREMKIKARNITFFGGIAGLISFLVVGLLPSLLYGGYAGVILGSAIFGSPVHEHVLAQAIVALGVISGVLAVGGIFVLGGAIVATGIYGTLSALAAASEVEQELVEEKNPTA
jgi:hypothetical protein